MNPEGLAETHPSPVLVRWAVTLVRRLDTLVAAALLTAGLALDPARRYCSEMECNSARDTALLITLLAASGLGIAALLWRASRRWWIRVAVLIAAPYVAIQLPNWLAHFGSWEVPTATGRTCVVRFGMREEEIRSACGDRSARCEGPKYFESASVWNPVKLTACGFSGVIYGDRLIILSCRGTADRVVAAMHDGKHEVGCVIRDGP